MKLILSVLALSFLSITIDAKVCNCRISVQPRILNGTPVRGPVPWQVAIRSGQNLVCTGVLVKENYVLTTAECVKDSGSSSVSYNVVYGVNNLTSYTDNVAQVSYIYKHPNFSPYRIENGSDIALLKLYNSVKLQPRQVELACLDFNFIRSAENERLYATGFGITDEFNKTASQVARFAYFNQTTNDWNKSYIIAAKALNENQTICDQDQGGPLHHTVNGLSKVVGLSSYTDSGFDKFGNVVYCTSDAYFTNLSPFKSFVTSYIGNDYCSL